MAAPSLMLLKKAETLKEGTVPVTITKGPNANGLALLKKLGVHANGLEWLKTSGYGLSLKANGLLFLEPPSNICLHHISMSAAFMTGLSNNEEDDEERDALCAMAEEIIDKLIEKGPVKMGAMDLLPKASIPSPNNIADVPVLASTYPIDKMTTGDRIKLRDATLLYQPVSASSPNSRYYVVASHPELKVAVRWKKGQVSIRIEGPDLDKHNTVIEQALGTSNQGDYFSLHVVTNDSVVTRKVIGAVLLALDVQFVTSTPDLKVIQGK